MMPADPNFAARVRESFDRQGMMVTLGARLVQVDPGAVEIRATIQPGLTQQAGFAHGGLAFAIGDSAAGYAALSLLPADREVLTIEMKINFLAPGQGRELIARGRVIRSGRTISAVAADVLSCDTDGPETLIATLQGTMIATMA